MLGVAQNYKKIYEMYNFDFDPEPGSAQYVVDQRIKRVSAVECGVWKGLLPLPVPRRCVAGQGCRQEGQGKGLARHY